MRTNMRDNFILRVLWLIPFNFDSFINFINNNGETILFNNV